jgi:hypothetical protein
MASDPYAGMAWMHMQIAAGLLRLGHDVTYVEATMMWPYNPEVAERVRDPSYAIAYLARVCESFGMGDRWAYRRRHPELEWVGPRGRGAEALLVGADAVLNITGATRLARERLQAGRVVYYGTDPGYHELAVASGAPKAQWIVEEHDDVVTYGENLGNEDCMLPALPKLRSKTRQPVLLDVWRAGGPTRNVFTTVSNWRQPGRDIEYGGRTYRWSKHHEFLKFISVPRDGGPAIELATGLANLSARDRDKLESNGWALADAHAFTTDPWRYRDYIHASRGEFTVAKDQYVAPRTGWFSERSACYLGAGRPVVSQDTGFGNVLPTGEGLFAVGTAEEAGEALAMIDRDYERHSRAARAIAEEFFAAERVLAKVVEDLGL